MTHFFYFLFFFLFFLNVIQTRSSNCTSPISWDATFERCIQQINLHACVTRVCNTLSIPLSLPFSTYHRRFPRVLVSCKARERDRFEDSLRMPNFVQPRECRGEIGRGQKGRGDKLSNWLISYHRCYHRDRSVRVFCADKETNEIEKLL